ncbi:hypothetical protein Mapa_002970 [Marchantia paleacea]|nr:hypothetical protein Mapa_002970 [Marchantia paleacea]
MFCAVMNQVSNLRFSSRCLMLLCLLNSLGLIKGDYQVDALHTFSQGVEVLSNYCSHGIHHCQTHVPGFMLPATQKVKLSEYLGNAGLSGTIAPRIGNLSHLHYLELFQNNLTGAFPEELGRLQNLVSLDLYDNNLSGPIPSSLGNLSLLRILRFYNNSLSGAIPMSLTNLSSLEILDLSYNDFSGEVPMNGSFSLFTPRSFEGNPGLCGQMVGKQCVGGPALAQFHDPSPPEEFGPASAPCFGGDCELAPGPGPAHERLGFFKLQSC